MAYYFPQIYQSIGRERTQGTPAAGFSLADTGGQISSGGGGVAPGSQIGNIINPFIQSGKPTAAQTMAGMKHWASQQDISNLKPIAQASQAIKSVEDVISSKSPEFIQGSVNKAIQSARNSPLDQSYSLPTEGFVLPEYMQPYQTLQTPESFQTAIGGPMAAAAIRSDPRFANIMSGLKQRAEGIPDARKKLESEAAAAGKKAYTTEQLKIKAEQDAAAEAAKADKQKADKEAADKAARDALVRPEGKEPLGPIYGTASGSYGSGAKVQPPQTPSPPPTSQITEALKGGVATGAKAGILPVAAAIGGLPGVAAVGKKLSWKRR